MSERTTVVYSFPKEELQTIKHKMLNWLRPFSIFAYLDNNGYNHQPNRYELLVAAGAVRVYHRLPEQYEDWLFGHFAYDYKNIIEPKLSSSKEDKTGIEDCFFFQPEIVAAIDVDHFQLNISCVGQEPATVLQQILAASPVIVAAVAAGPVTWQHFFSKEDYLQAVADIRNHIEEGDCYELNFCTGALAEQATIDPVATFHKLNTVNPSPFAALYKNADAWLLCASPERFLYRNEEELVSQPIKGTARRSSDPEADQALQTALLHDEKERAENVMIVDLVRNDLAKSCKVGSVQVPELCGVYTFPQVHQLISTVSGMVKPGLGNRQIMENAFPMGSMTGAPKVMVMELIERYERFRRGLYAGTVGYITPQQDFDFNVVIRSLIYNAESGLLCYQTGGAITYDSVAEQEWEEVRLKAGAMEQIFL